MGKEFAFYEEENYAYLALLCTFLPYYKREKILAVWASYYVTINIITTPTLSLFLLPLYPTYLKRASRYTFGILSLSFFIVFCPFLSFLSPSHIRTGPRWGCMHVCGIDVRIGFGMVLGMGMGMDFVGSLSKVY